MIKKFLGIVLLVLVFAAGFAAGLTAKYYIDEWRAKRNVALWMKSLESPEVVDNYGGKTPEETFDMYIAALKKGDLELASRYFLVNDQYKQLKYLQEKDRNNNLNDYILELNNIKTGWTREDNGPSTVIYTYKVTIDNTKQLEIRDPKTNKLMQTIDVIPGEYTHTVTFKNTNNIWKIYLL